MPKPLRTKKGTEVGFSNDTVQNVASLSEQCEQILDECL